jgi:hypothetical protein
VQHPPQHDAQLLTIDKKHITQKFFEEVAVQVRRAFERANKDAETWLRAIMAPMETQVREHQIQLKRRLESIKRIHQATDTLEDRIAELCSGQFPCCRSVRPPEAVFSGCRLRTGSCTRPRPAAAIKGA